MADGRVILAMDSVLAACSVAIWKDGQILAHARAEGRRGHAERLPGMTGQVLAEAGLTQQDLTHYAVTRGPGSFAGIRVALSAVRAMALVSGLPIIGLSSLHVLAAGVSDQERAIAQAEGRQVLVLFDARRDQLYMQAFQADAALTPLEEPTLVSVSTAQDRLQQGSWLLVGSGAGLVTGQDCRLVSGLCDAETSPDAMPLARLAGLAPVTEGPVEPLYIRQPDAKLPGGKDLPGTTFVPTSQAK